MKLENAILSNFVRRFFRLKFAPSRTKGCQLSMLARWKRADCQSLSLPGLSNLSKKSDNRMALMGGCLEDLVSRLKLVTICCSLLFSSPSETSNGKFQPSFDL